MNYYKKQDLLSAVDKGTTLIDLEASDISSILVSEYGGRPLGFFPNNEACSLLWINWDIKETIKARSRLIGGDRYWISPERDFFYKDPNTYPWKEWFCPEGLDPAKYEVIGSSNKACTVSSAVSVVNQRTKERYDGEITRQFKVIKEPIKTGLSYYCGLEFIDDCVFFKSNLKINGWTLANIISGGANNPGTVLIPTKPNAKLIPYFRIIPNERMHISDNYVAFKIDGSDIYKLAVRPEDINFEKKAKIGYVLKLPQSNDYGFLVKLSDDVPKSQKECFDVPRDRPDSEIGVIQTFNSESPSKEAIKYGEIELQLNPFETIEEVSHGKAKHQLIGYIGSKDEILGAIEKYLGISNPLLF